MLSRRQSLAMLLQLALLVSAGRARPARRPDTETELMARLQRETDPVKKAKLEIRLARLKLHAASEAFDKGNIEEANQQLAAYLERVKSAWGILKGSGRSAQKKPAGFKDLDIALREDARFLDDLQHRVSYMVRAPVEKAAKEIEAVRNEVLKALFPRETPRKPSSMAVRRVVNLPTLRKI